MKTITYEQIREAALSPTHSPFSISEIAQLAAIHDPKTFYITFQRLLKKYRLPEPKTS